MTGLERWNLTVEQTYLDGLLVKYLIRNMTLTLKEMIARENLYNRLRQDGDNSS